MPNRRWPRGAALAVVTWVLASCGGAAGPSPPPPPPPPPAPASLALVSGAGRADTIGTTFGEPVTVEVKRTGGQLAAGELVRFTVVPLTVPAAYYPICVSARSAAPSCAETMDTARTGADGRTGAFVRFQFIAGPAWLRIEVAGLGLVDSASYTVLPGGTLRVLALPADTAVLVGGTVRLDASARDRGSNRRSDPVTITPVSGPVAIDADGVITGTGIGRAVVAVSADGRDTTVSVSVVPEATIYGRFFGSAFGIGSFRTDGANAKLIVDRTGTAIRGGSPTWSPDGKELAFYDVTVIKVLDQAGDVRVVPNAPTDLVPLVGPIGFGPGRLLYFTRFIDPLFSGWRIAADGTGLLQVTDTDGGWRLNPSPDPSDDTVVYERPVAFHVNELVRRHLLTGVVEALNLIGDAPHVSPDGGRIAYLGDGKRLFVANADGSNPVVLTPARVSFDFGWSPDGKWIIAQALDSPSAELVLVEVATGLNLPLRLRPLGAFPVLQPVFAPNP